MTRATANANSRQDGAPSDPACGNGAKGESAFIARSLSAFGESDLPSLAQIAAASAVI
jgi:hypothetical protein